MNREQIATTDTYNLPVKQDSLNPNLKNTIQRFVNLDSQFRQYTSGADSTSTDYTLDLSDTLKNALSLRLYSYQIPFSWYAIDTAYGNTCFWIVDSTSGLSIPVSVPSGNYTPTDFVTQLNKSFLNAGFSFPARSTPYDVSANTPVYFNSNSGILTLLLYDGTYSGIDSTTNNSISFTISNSTTIVFYDFTSVLQCKVRCNSSVNHFFNNTLGWLMGFKLPYVSVEVNGNVASSVLDLNGTKYLILVIDDYNQNHLNNGLVSITEYYNTIKTPNYYSPDLPYTCLAPNAQTTLNGSGFNDLSNMIAGINNEASNGLLVADKMTSNIRYSKTAQLLPSAPRTLTQAQLYTINEIFKKNNSTTNYRTKAPTTPDIFALIPVKSSGGTTGELLVEFSGSLQQNIRTYFGPVNIERMRIRLLDDKGNQVNLNGGDWCFTIICECFYQY